VEDLVDGEERWHGGGGQLARTAAGRRHRGARVSHADDAGSAEKKEGGKSALGLAVVVGG
jgi:hypothetical protein